MNELSGTCYIIAASTVLIVILVVAYIRAQIARRKTLLSQFGQVPPDADQPVQQSVSRYWKEREKHENIAHYIDDITWDDLDMDKVYARLNSCHTTIGEECLYAILHEPLFSSGALAQREALIRLLTEDEQLRLDLQVILTKMGKSTDNGLSSFCYDISSKRIKHPLLYKILALAPLVCIVVGVLLNVVVGLIAMVACFIVYAIIHYKKNEQLKMEFAAIKYFTVLLWCAKKLHKQQKLFMHDIGNNIKSGYMPFKKSTNKLSTMFRERVSEFDVALEYLKIIFLYNIRTYNRTVGMIEKNIGSFRNLYAQIGELDAAIAIASYRASLPCYCLPN